MTVPDDRFGPLEGQLLHFSYGAGTPLSWCCARRSTASPKGPSSRCRATFSRASHRGRFNPKDGQLYVTGMAGWGTYTSADGCFQRVRYTGGPVQLPTAFHAHENGVLLTFSRPLDPAIAGRPDRHFAQAWNYRYSAGYGSPELSPRHPGQPGHDPLAIRSAHVLADGRTLFLEIPELQPVNQLHLHVRPGDGAPIDLFATVHQLAAPFTGFPGYRPVSKTIAAHPDPGRHGRAQSQAGAQPLAQPDRGRAAYHDRSRQEPELLAAVVHGPRRRADQADVRQPRRGAAQLGPASARIAAPGSATWSTRSSPSPTRPSRHYIPRTDDVLVYTDIVGAQDQFIIYFRAPQEKGRYPYLCTFPGHWMVMNGEMIVE